MLFYISLAKLYKFDITNTLKGTKDMEMKKRPMVLSGRTYKIKVPNHNDEQTNTYITINDDMGKPFEMFINGFDPSLYEYLSQLMIFVSRFLRMGVEAEVIIKDLKSIHSAKGPHVFPGRGMSPSLAASIGTILEMHINNDFDDIKGNA